MFVLLMSAATADAALQIPPGLGLIIAGLIAALLIVRTLIDWTIVLLKVAALLIVVWTAVQLLGYVSSSLS